MIDVETDQTVMATLEEEATRKWHWPALLSNDRHSSKSSTPPHSSSKPCCEPKNWAFDREEEWSRLRRRHAKECHDFIVVAQLHCEQFFAQRAGDPERLQLVEDIVALRDRRARLRELRREHHAVLGLSLELECLRAKPFMNGGRSSRVGSRTARRLLGGWTVDKVREVFRQEAKRKWAWPALFKAHGSDAFVSADFGAEQQAVATSTAFSSLPSAKACGIDDDWCQLRHRHAKECLDFIFKNSIYFDRESQRHHCSQASSEHAENSGQPEEHWLLKDIRDEHVAAMKRESELMRGIIALELECQRLESRVGEFFKQATEFADQALKTKLLEFAAGCQLGSETYTDDEMDTFVAVLEQCVDGGDMEWMVARSMSPIDEDADGRWRRVSDAPTVSELGCRARGESPEADPCDVSRMAEDAGIRRGRKSNTPAVAEVRRRAKGASAEPAPVAAGRSEEEVGNRRRRKSDAPAVSEFGCRVKGLKSGNAGSEVPKLSDAKPTCHKKDPQRWTAGSGFGPAPDGKPKCRSKETRPMTPARGPADASAGKPIRPPRDPKQWTPRADAASSPARRSAYQAGVSSGSSTALLSGSGSDTSRSSLRARHVDAWAAVYFVPSPCKAVNWVPKRSGVAI